MDDVSQTGNRMNFTVNGVGTEIECPHSMRLSDVLREKFGLRDTKIGCNAGIAGHAQSFLMVIRSAPVLFLPDRPVAAELKPHCR